jgi:uncharacterized protein YndB with AHSA1/START domain
MQTTLDEISTTTTIDAPIDTVWEAITTPSLIKQWFFGVDTTSDWTVGSPLVHTGEYQGKPYVDKGEILRIQPPRLLEHSHWSEISGKADRPDQYQVVTWGLAERGDGTELTVSERNLPSKEAAETSEGAWKMALGKLKELLEQTNR